MEPVEVHIDQIHRNAMFQPRKSTNPETIHRYASAYKSGAVFPPIKLAKVKGALVLVDGWHRVAALESIGQHRVMAVVVEATVREAQWMAAEANLTHGLQLKASELRNAFKMYIKAGKYRDEKKNLKSYRDIAKELGGLRSYSTIRNWLKKDFPRIAQLMGGQDGRDTGGLQEEAERDSFLDDTARFLHEALAAFKGIADSADRGKMIALARTVVQEMEAGAEWRIEPEDF